MNKQELDEALNQGIVIMFDDFEELRQFLAEVKALGGCWLSGETITVPQPQNRPKEKLWLHIDRQYRLANVMNICLYYGAYPTLDYRKFASGKAVIPTKTNRKS